jgi:GNAT superfamily N-acetyltransferase
MLPAHQIHTYIQPDPLPPEAVELFGHEVEQAWQGSSDQPPSVCIGVTTDGQWLAGIWMLLEMVEQPSSPPLHVASIRQLIVSPAARGQGLAGRLLRRAMTVASSNGCSHIRSTAGFGCIDHLTMYHRLGFERLSGQRPYLVMRKLPTASQNAGE